MVAPLCKCQPPRPSSHRVSQKEGRAYYCCSENACGFFNWEDTIKTTLTLPGKKHIFSCNATHALYLLSLNFHHSRQVRRASAACRPSSRRRASRRAWGGPSGAVQARGKSSVASSHGTRMSLWRGMASWCPALLPCPCPRLPRRGPLAASAMPPSCIAQWATATPRYLPYEYHSIPQHLANYHSNLHEESAPK